MPNSPEMAAAGGDAKRFLDMAQTYALLVEEKTVIWGIASTKRHRNCYLSGSEAQYVKRDSLRLQGGGVAFDTAGARQELLSFGIGVVFDFDF